MGLTIKVHDAVTWVLGMAPLKVEKVAGGYGNGCAEEARCRREAARCAVGLDHQGARCRGMGAPLKVEKVAGGYGNGCAEEARRRGEAVHRAVWLHRVMA
ncbi:hypothetical protein PHYPSEUDO_011743 [Phytophthora pseudosyringae]|uniref:Uncharacterized protein n=1 Tax=Phytophthora pseudosyringae TaxID=221518 RepID=A0A8T1V7V7_9STRA|nr:hypothetical protein PHYPSEUDO_011743 [Phytophthora pseudosyringae]